MLWKRVLSAGIPLPLVLLLIHLGPTWGWGIFIGLCVAVAFYEYLTIVGAAPGRNARFALVAVGVAAFWGFHDLGADKALVILVGLFLLSYIALMVRPGDIRQAFPRAAALFTGFVYVPLLLAFLVRLHPMPAGREWIYVALLIAWCGDTAAYFAGRAFGRHKLYPAISPGKTWEGAAGGLLGSLTGVVVLKLTLFPALTVLDCFLVALPGGALGQVGDLCESMLKRSFSVKDSGTIMPGHGGLLDRIDALVFILPYIYAYALYLHPIVI